MERTVKQRYKKSEDEKIKVILFGYIFFCLAYSYPMVVRTIQMESKTKGRRYISSLMTTLS